MTATLPRRPAVQPLTAAAVVNGLFDDFTIDPDPSESIQLEALTLAVAANLPVLLWGEPGIGKTAVISQLADALNVKLFTIIASIHEPSDFSGMPIIGADPANDGVPMAPPEWALKVSREGGLLFFDELSAAPPAVQAALLRVVLERQVGSHTLPDDVRIVAAANPPGSAADGWHLTPPLANRFVHLPWTHNAKVVAEGLAGTWPSLRIPTVRVAEANGAVAKARGLMSGYLQAQPQQTHAMPDNTEERGGAWPSPRTWEMAMRLFGFGLACAASTEAITMAVAGAVGNGAAVEFMNYVDKADLPDPNAVLADPHHAQLPKRGDQQLAFLSALAAAVKMKTNAERWAAAWVVLGRVVTDFAPDIGVRAARELMAIRPAGVSTPEEARPFAEIIRLTRDVA